MATKFEKQVQVDFVCLNGFWVLWFLVGFLCGLFFFQFNDCRMGFGWTDITADSPVCLQSLLKRLASHLKTRSGQQ